MVLKLQSALALVEEEFKNIPLKVETWFTPEPLLLLIVFLEQLYGLLIEFRGDS